MANLSSYFAHKHVVVTGGSLGIGYATAKQLLDLGATVTIVARREKPLEEAAEKLRSGGKTVLTLALDVADDAVVEQKLGDHLDAHPAQMIVNNAGVTMPGRFLELDKKHYRELMDINYFGAVNVCRTALPRMIKSGGGHVANVGSLLSVFGIYGYSAYCASKFALYGFSEALRAEMWPHDVRVSILLPPDTDTPQHAFELPLLPKETKAIAGTVKMLSADDVATSLLHGMAKNDFEIVPGVDGRVTVAAQRLMPRIVRWYCDFAQKKA